MKNIKTILALTLWLLFMTSVGLTSGCNDKIKIYEGVSVDSVSVVGWEASARCGFFGCLVADYIYWPHTERRALLYETNEGKYIIVLLDNNDSVITFWRSGSAFTCSELENAKRCQKAQEKVVYWKNILKWHKRVPYLLRKWNSGDDLD